MKRVLYTILILAIGIAIGFSAGFLTGLFRKEQQKNVPEAAESTPLPTKQPTLTPAEEMPEAEPTKQPTLTPAEETPEAEPTKQPTLTPAEETPEAEPTKQPTLTPAEETPEAEPTKQPTLTPAEETPEAEPTKQPTLTPAAALDDFFGTFHVEGTHLAAADGSPVQLRGISTHGLGWFSEYVNTAMIAQAGQEWGCNVFRLAMYTAEYNGYCTSDGKQKEKLKNIIDSGVQAAIEQNMYVIIDWHILSDGNPNTYKEEAKQFFAEMAEKYADVPNVLYEICNEPNGGTSWSEIRSYALEIIPVIRKYAPEAVIIVGTPTWSQDVDVAARNPITEYDNIMYALHFYAATHTDGLRNKCRTAVSEGLPLFVTEYGICDASGNGAINEEQARQWMELLDDYGISHVMWNLSNKSETSAMINSSCSKTGNLQNEDLSAAGKWFVRMMQNAGVSGGSFTTPENHGSAAGNSESNGNSGNSAGNGTSEGSGNTGNSSTAQAAGELKLADIFEIPQDMELVISNSWASGQGYSFQLNVVIKNNGATDETDWVRTLNVKPDKKVTVSQCWCAKIAMEENLLTIRPEDYNKTVPAGGEVGGIGIIVEVK